MRNGSFKIEKGVPFNGMKGVRLFWPFADMKPGDSFLVPCHSAQDARSAMCWWGRRHNQKFGSRKMPDGENVRVWRLE